MHGLNQRQTRSRQMTDVIFFSLLPSDSLRPSSARSSSTRSRTRMPPRSAGKKFQNSRRARPLSRPKFAGRSSSIAKSSSNAHSSRPKSNVCDGLPSLAPHRSLDLRSSRHQLPRLRPAQRRRRRRHGTPLQPLPPHFLQCRHLRVSLPLAPRAPGLRPIGGRQACVHQPPPAVRPSRMRRTFAAPRLLQRLPNRDRHWRTLCTARHPLLFLDR